MDSSEAAIARLCDPAAEVSAHYLVDRAGVTTGIVAEDRRAWHAGAGEWRGSGDMNSRSIGIELDNDGTSPFAAPLMDEVGHLLKSILKRWAIPPQNVIGHADMAPGRKADPGPRFDWARLQRLGLAADLDFVPKRELFHDTFDATECAALLRRVGYTSDAPLAARLQAFRDRFLPVSQGLPNDADQAMIRQYLKRYGSSSPC